MSSTNDPVRIPGRAPAVDGHRRDHAPADGAVRCPRKGPMADAIAWGRCVEMSSAQPFACAEHHCRQQDVALHAIEVRRHLGGSLGPENNRPKGWGPRVANAAAVVEPVASPHRKLSWKPPKQWFASLLKAD